MTARPEARFVREGDWLVVRMAGRFELDWVVGVIATIGEHVRSTPTAALLVDSNEMFGAIPDLDRYRFAMATVEQRLAGPIAFFGKEPIVDPARFGEIVARNRGVNVRVFTDEPAAREWLREQTRPASPV